jgi:hypothetical protein
MKTKIVTLVPGMLELKHTDEGLWLMFMTRDGSAAGMNLSHPYKGAVGARVFKKWAREFLRKQAAKGRPKKAQ